VLKPDDLDLPAAAEDVDGNSFRAVKAGVVRRFEREYLEGILRLHQGNIAQAAAAAHKNRRAFWELLRKHGLHGTSS
jgi:DNA-binding NtrC family response regulator